MFTPGQIICDMHGTNLRTLVALQHEDPRLRLPDGWEIIAPIDTGFPFVSMIEQTVREQSGDRYWTYHNKFLVILGKNRFGDGYVAAFSYDGRAGGICHIKPID